MNTHVLPKLDSFEAQTEKADVGMCLCTNQSSATFEQVWSKHTHISSVEGSCLFIYYFLMLDTQFWIKFSEALLAEDLTG